MNAENSKIFIDAAYFQPNSGWKGDREMATIFGNQLDLRELTQPMDCYCVSRNNFVYDKYSYTILPSGEKPCVHEFHEAFRLILVPVGRAMCTDDGREVKVGMFLN